MTVIPLPVRIQARAVIVNDLGEILLVKHVDEIPADPNEPERLEYWVAPGGGLEEDETHLECALREAHEETSVTGLTYLRELLVYEKPLRYGEQMMLMQAHYLLFRHIGRSELRPDPNENITDVRWWPIEEIERSNETFLPRELFASLREDFSKE